MNIILRFLYCVLFCALCFGSASARAAKLAKAIDSLDIVLNSYDDFRLKRSQTLDSMRQSAEYGGAERLYELGRAYTGFNNDSAARILERAMQFAAKEGDSVILRNSKIALASVWPKSGIFTDAINMLQRMDVGSLSTPQRAEYYGTKSQVMINAAKYPPFRHHAAYYDSIAVVLLDSLRTFMSAGGMGERMVIAQKELIEGDSTLAFSELNEVLEHTEPGSPLYAVLTGMMSKYFENDPSRSDEHLYYLALSAITDINNANGEAESLLRLGNELFKRGDYDHAFEYLTAAGKFMAESGSRTLITEIAPPVAVYSQIIKKREERRTILIFTFLAVVIIVIACAIAFCYRTVMRRHEIENKYRKITASITSRDQYINELLNLCSVYVESMEDYNKLISRKLKANQAQDLLKMVESGKSVQDQTDKFFTVFDHAISKIYPDFVNDINKLLQPEKQFPPQSGEKLIPELRIAAFMRLGVTDSNRLSKFLGLSLNTIYTYRNRLKSRAISRDNFESSLYDLDKKHGPTEAIKPEKPVKGTEKS